MAEQKVLLVRLGKDLYAIPIGAIAEVLPALPIEAVPQCPAFVRGVIFVRGHLIPVVSAAERLGLKSQPTDEPSIVCLRVGERLVGVEFDESLDLMDVGTARILPSAAIGAGEGFFTGVVDQDGLLIRILDPEKLTTHEEKQQWAHADSGNGA